MLSHLEAALAAWAADEIRPGRRALRGAGCHGCPGPCQRGGDGRRHGGHDAPHMSLVSSLNVIGCIVTPTPQKAHTGSGAAQPLPDLAFREYSRPARAWRALGGGRGVIDYRLLGP